MPSEARTPAALTTFRTDQNVKEVPLETSERQFQDNQLDGLILTNHCQRCTLARQHQ
jgi:hypothetical protein